MYLLLHTPFSLAALIVRIALGVVTFPHGAQKVLGWFGGPGFKATLEQFNKEMGIPTPLAVLAMAAEFLGSIGLIVGCLTRIAAFGIACTMIVAALMVHWRFGFFMNWFGEKQGNGVEYHILAIGIALSVIVSGGGMLSLDRAILRLIGG
jgi:putative oxidoreductase